MLDSDLTERETERLTHQVALDSERTAQERNAMGQFATPPVLAADVMRFALALHGQRPIRFLEPSCGSGSFFSALLAQATESSIEAATGIELDERFADVAENLWGSHGLRVLRGDFFDQSQRLTDDATLLVANPPYVRHHHLTGDQKRALQARTKVETGIRVSGLAGLYVYFLLLSHRLLAPGAVSAWLIPSEFLDTNYGKAIRQYLAQKVTLNRIHRFDPEGTQFDDALVTSAVVVFTNAAPPAEHRVSFTQGGTTNTPEAEWFYRQSSLDPRSKWGRLFSDGAVLDADRPPYPRFDMFLKIRRGIATGNKDFFVLPREEIERRGIRRSSVVPMMPQPRHLKDDVIEGDREGYPVLDSQAAVIHPHGSTVAEVRENDPAMADYLESVDQKTLDAYLVKSRRVWFQTENREPAPFLLTYMGRGTIKIDRPFRFILNRSQAITSNMFLMLYPIGPLADALDRGETTLEAVFEALLSITAEELLAGGRVYGGGLRKIEPRELAAMDAHVIADLLPNFPMPEATAEHLF